MSETETIAPTPITTPSVERRVRSGLARRASKPTERELRAEIVMSGRNESSEGGLSPAYARPEGVFRPNLPILQG